MSFETELKDLLNRYSMESQSDTPDFLLAEYMIKCLDAFNELMKKRKKWYGKEE